MRTMTETLWRSIHDCGETLYRIAAESGVSYAQVHRFYTGRRGLKLETADRLALYFGLVLKPRDGRKGKSRKRKRTAR